jgi:hypothetical protein
VPFIHFNSLPTVGPYCLSRAHSELTYILESNPHLVFAALLNERKKLVHRLYNFFQNPALDRESYPHSILIRIWFFSPSETVKRVRIRFENILLVSQNWILQTIGSTSLAYSQPVIKPLHIQDNMNRTNADFISSRRIQAHDPNAWVGEITFIPYIIRLLRSANIH